VAAGAAWPAFTFADGELDRRPVDEKPRSYRYNPGDPVITMGGCEWVNYPCGPYDQKPLNARRTS
jgi:hypothetical protein